ncbi:MAG: 3-phosphoshikimate 1-carboxyvinyltransferase [Candidatus Altiarchaeales archaeon]|nr:3-phosphoshikimate 1-carboxyvinyltransferase [Candidatus Altiarchaeales archaeon]
MLTINPVDCLTGSIEAPSSKSYTIRALMAASLAEGEVVVHKPLVSDDTSSCFRVCEDLGARISLHDDYLIVYGTAGQPTPKRVIDCGNSGTTMRLATAIASVSNKNTSFKGDASLNKRPISPLLEALNQMGVATQSTHGTPPHTVEGPLRGGGCSITGDVSSQFISALLFACPCAKKNSEIKVRNPPKSRPYIDMTLDTLKSFQVYIENHDYLAFNVLGNQSYVCRQIKVEGDYSSAAFILSAASLTEGVVEVGNLHINSLQADRKIVSILRQMGASIEVAEEAVTVYGGDLKGIEVDLSNCPDLLPIVSVLGVYAEGETRIVNCEHARYKECDRIYAMASELGKMGADVSEEKDGLTLRKSRLHGTQLNGFRDHRIVMALAVAALRAEGETKVTDDEYINITYPEFKHHMTVLEAQLS